MSWLHWLDILGTPLVMALFWFCGWWDKYSNGRPIYQYHNVMEEMQVAQQADQQEKKS